MWPTFGLGFRDFMPITDSILVVNDQKIDQFIEQITRHSTRRYAPRSNPRLLDQSFRPLKWPPIWSSRGHWSGKENQENITKVIEPNRT